jgi:hypothetical protein
MSAAALLTTASWKTSRGCTTLEVRQPTETTISRFGLWRASRASSPKVSTGRAP